MVLDWALLYNLQRRRFIYHEYDYSTTPNNVQTLGLTDYHTCGSIYHTTVQLIFFIMGLWNYLFYLI